MEPWLITTLTLITIIAAVVLYEFGRQFYYWSAAKILGWTEHEKFVRKTAGIGRAVEEDERLATRMPLQRQTQIGAVSESISQQ
jgi:hypothetical protein